MSDVTHIKGSISPLVFDLSASIPGFTFTPAEWTVEVTLVAKGQNLDLGDVVWVAGTLSEEDGVVYGQGPIGGAVDPDPGDYFPYARLTSIAYPEMRPVIRPEGIVTVEAM